MIDSDATHNVSSFVIDDKARFRLGSDHALLECILTFRESQPKITWQYQDIIYYNISEGTKYETYVQELDNSVSSISLREFERLPMSDMLQHLTGCVNYCAQKTIGIKVAKKRRGRRLPPANLQLIESKNKLISENCSSESTPEEILLNKERIKVHFTI